MKIGSTLENQKIEKRIAITPEIAKKYISLGFDVQLSKNYGTHLGITDDVYEKIGVKFLSDDKEIINLSNIIVQLGLLSDDKSSLLKEDQTLIGVLNPYDNKEKLDVLKDKKIKLFSLELLPRITRAQSMDILSSQSNLAGYKAVIDATYLFNKAMPMMMTAAGTIAPAKVMVFGAGVAGLQAIATAKRLGAIVSATDVRMAAKEQVESLGGKFVMVEDDETQDAETSGGYAKEMSDEFKAKQAKLISDTLATQDIAICTALIPGKKAPILISEEQVRSMKPGSIIIDLAAESGGNCECSVAGETKEVGGVHVVGSKDITSTISEDASALFSKNILNFLTLLIDSESKSISIDWDDEIIQGILVTKNNEIVHKELS